MKAMRHAMPAVALVLLAAGAGAQPKPSTSTPTSTATPPSHLKLDVRKSSLDNGLRVVLSVDHTSPTVAVDVVYDVGARNEERGHSGFAHLFEHMMFQGSANVPRGDHFKLVTGHGGQLNGTTSSDRTNYFEMMPRSELPLALWLEADRMKSLDISQKNFENQRAVVKEEYRMRVENAAYVPAELRLEELIFQGYWPYEHPAIGSMRDLDAAELDWVRGFHDAYYGPNNAVVSVSGDIEPDETMELIKRFFGGAKAIPSVPKYEPGAIDEQTAPRDAVVEDAHAKLPGLMYAWAIPSIREPDHYALEMAAMLLADGESSRLYKLLVRERSVAIEVEAETARHRGPDELEIIAKLSGGASVAIVSRLIDQEIAGIARNGPTEAEMGKLRSRKEAQYVLGLQSNFARAQRLAEFELYRGDANLINIELDRYLSVTKEDVRRVVAKYLTRTRRSTVEVRPAADAKPTAPSAQPKSAPPPPVVQTKAATPPNPVPPPPRQPVLPNPGAKK